MIGKGSIAVEPWNRFGQKLCDILEGYKRPGLLDNKVGNIKYSFNDTSIVDKMKLV